MNPLDRITQLTDENRQLRRSVDELRAQVGTARQELAREAGTIAKLAKDKQDIRLRCDSGDELLNAILLWIEADMRQTPPPAESMAAFFLPTFCKNTRAHLSRHA